MAETPGAREIHLMSEKGHNSDGGEEVGGLSKEKREARHRREIPHRAGGKGGSYKDYEASGE